MIRWTCIFASCLLWLSAGTAIAAAPSPYEIIQKTADELLVVVKSRRAELEASPAALYEVVDQILRPNFDVAYAGRLVLGRYWQRSTADQRERFTEALYQSVVRKYARGLLGYDEDTVRIFPQTGLIGVDQDFVTVKTEVNAGDSIKVPVNYRTRWVDGSWKVFDVIVEGLSYVTYYRDLIGKDVRNKGLDTVIENLSQS
ncbi:MAG: ABC transporter substrate-binding protein [Gammaproteobacteria bacterium]